MAVEVIAGQKARGDDEECAVLYCTTSGHVFGPLFTDVDEAEEFLQFMRRQSIDPRSIDSESLSRMVVGWREGNAVHLVESGDIVEVIS